MLIQLAGFIFDCTCIILPKPIVHIVHIDNYCYLYYSTLFIPFPALYFILHLSYTLKRVTLRINHSLHYITFIEEFWSFLNTDKTYLNGLDQIVIQ